MKPDHYQRDQALAAEYVLGTLSGLARRRFETWMMESERLRRRVWYWERRLAPLNAGLAPVAPPEAVWLGINETLRRRPRRRALWAALVGGLAAAALVAAVLLVARPFQSSLGPRYLGVVQNNSGQPLWVVESRPDSDSLKVRGIRAGDAGPGKDYELWILPRSGPPQPLGVLPGDKGARDIQLSGSESQALRASGRLAISLEKRGGSLTGRPQGPVLYQFHLLRIPPRLNG